MYATSITCNEYTISFVCTIFFCHFFAFFIVPLERLGVAYETYPDGVTFLINSIDSCLKLISSDIGSDTFNLHIYAYIIFAILLFIEEKGLKKR